MNKQTSIISAQFKKKKKIEKRRYCFKLNPTLETEVTPNDQRGRKRGEKTPDKTKR